MFLYIDRKKTEPRKSAYFIKQKISMTMNGPPRQERNTYTHLHTSKIEDAGFSVNLNPEVHFTKDRPTVSKISPPRERMMGRMRTYDSHEISLGNNSSRVIERRESSAMKHETSSTYSEKRSFTSGKKDHYLTVVSRLPGLNKGKNLKVAF